MRSIRTLLCALLGLALSQTTSSSAVQRIDLAERLTAGRLRVVNRQATRLPEPRDAVHLSAGEKVGLAWVEGSDFRDGTIEVDVRGKDVFQQSFLGVAFHGKNDTTYESVYIRPFNFRATDPARYRHAVQYMTLPEFDWPRLRERFPEEFENEVNRTLSPIDWVPLRIVVRGPKVQVSVGQVANLTLDVRKLGTLDRGLVGLWVGNTSDGDFANLRITAAP
jgi:hypothetical protein